MADHSHTEIAIMQVQIAEMDKKVTLHEKILVTGSDERLSLPEVVRALTNTINTYIKRKEQEEVDKKEEWKRLRWVILGTIIPAIIVFIAQATIFFFRFVPIMVSLSEQ